MELSFRIVSTLSANYGEEVASMFEIAVHIGPTTGIMKSYISNPAIRENISSQEISVHGLTAALGDPITRNGSFPGSLGREWQALVITLEEVDYYDTDAIREANNRINAWRDRVREWADPSFPRRGRRQ